MKFDHKWDLQWYEDRLKGREGTFDCVAETLMKLNCHGVIDVGGGAGLLRRFIPPWMLLTVVDRSPSSKLAGEKLFPDVNFITGEIDDVPGNRDAVVGIQLVEHMNGYEKFLKSAWDKANKVVIVSFRNGLDGHEKIELQRKCNDYWDNTYSGENLFRWIYQEFHLSEMTVNAVDVSRDYSPELVLVLEKGLANAKS